ncbi:MAG: hypothetical protein FJ303_04510 [Planctomycetes bacterium]|nr:hypothetical protein [Planctomycetota bacterium]
MAKKRKDDDEEIIEEGEPSGGSIPTNDAWTGMLAISLLALAAGTGFLAYDYYQYNDEKLPTVPKFVGSSPGTPAKMEPPKQEQPPPPKDKEPDKKDPEKNM